MFKVVMIAALSAVAGGVVAVVVTIAFLGWGKTMQGQITYVDVTRSDYIDTLLTFALIFLSSIGILLTIGAFALAVVAFKTLRDIKEEAKKEAKNTTKDEVSLQLKEMARNGELDAPLKNATMLVHQGGAVEDSNDDN